MLTCPFGVAISVDIEGNCRLYDLYRLKKISKLSSNNLKDGSDIRFIVNLCKWRLMPDILMDCSLDAFIGISQTPEAPAMS